MNIADNNDGYVEEDAVYETTAYMAERVMHDVPDETDFRTKRSNPTTWEDLYEFFRSYDRNQSDKPYEA